MRKTMPVAVVADVLAYCEAHCDNEMELRMVSWVAEHMFNAIPGALLLPTPDDYLREWWAFEERAVPLQAAERHGAPCVS